MDSIARDLHVLDLGMSVVFGVLFVPAMSLVREPARAGTSMQSSSLGPAPHT